MENKILIPLAIFALSILLVQSFYTIPNAMAQLSIEVVNFGASQGAINNQAGICEYISSTEVWCPSTDGIKIWNPTSRTLTATLLTGINIKDINCGNTLCFSWHHPTTISGNLTGWITSTKEKFNSTVFSNNANYEVGSGFGLFTGDGSSTVLLPNVSGQNCLGANNEVGVCVFDGISFIPSRFISASTTSISADVFDITWNGDTASVGNPSAPRAIVIFRDSVGNIQIYNLNLASAGTTFATTQICNTGNVAASYRIQIIGDFAFARSGAQDIIFFDTTNSSCSEITKSNLVDEDIVLGIQYDSGENVYIIASVTEGATDTSSVYAFNGTGFTSGTGFDRLAKINTTSTNPTTSFFLHNSQGEIQVWRGTDMVIISGIISTEEPDPNTEFCSIPANFNLLRCVLERGDTTPLVGASELVNQSSTNIVCQIGLIACTQDEDGNFTPDNPDIQTNGVGYLLLIVALGITIGVFWVASRGDLGSIPTFVWILATLSIIGIMTAFDWIDPTIFIVAIIAIIALATAKAKGIFGNSGLFAGDT